MMGHFLNQGIADNAMVQNTAFQTPSLFADSTKLLPYDNCVCGPEALL